MTEFWANTIEPGYYDRILKDGLKKNKGIQPNWHRSTFKKIATYINDNDRHLDYACGPGSFTGLFVDSNSTGVDISDDQINYAKKNYGYKTEFISLKDFELSQSKNKFEIITILGLLEFIDEELIIDLINDLYDTLKTDGKIILTTPNYGGAMFLLEKVLNIAGNLDYSNQYVNRFNKNKLNTIMKKTKFKNIKVKKFLNFGIFSSCISFEFSDKLMNFIDKLFSNFFGFLLLVEIKK